jgi:group I intron endonuclease
MIEKDDNLIMKEKKTNCGVYKITNLVPNEKTGICKVYIGSSINIKSRKNQHLSELRKGSHSNTHLQRAFKRDKEENFKWELIKSTRKIEDKKLLKEELLKYENLELNKYKKEDGTIDHNKCYNILVNAGSNLGSKLTEETKNKMSLMHKGKAMPEETKEKISKANKNKIFSIEHKNKLSKINLGKKLSEETKKKISVKMKNISKAEILGKKVINLDTKKVFETILQAAEYYNMKYSNNISCVCKGNRKTSGGYRWAYIN